MSQWIYGMRSSNKLQTCHLDLQRIFYAYARRQFFEITIVHGWRGEDVQTDAFLTGASTKPWPESKHNYINQETHIPESLAVDFAPWIPGMGIPWKDTHAFAVIGGILIAVADDMGVKVRYGGDWDMDGQTTDQTLMDWGHIELVR